MKLMIKTICAIIYNEHADLEEWIRYNLALGFNHIYLYEDYKSKSHSDITNKFSKVTLSNLEEFSIENTNSAKKQYLLYDKFLKRHQKLKDMDWIAFIDIDEFITLDDGYTLESMLEEYNDEYAVFLCWKNYSASGHLDKKQEGITNIEYYDKEVDIWQLHNDIRVMCKSIVNVNKDDKIKTVHITYKGVFTNYKPYTMRGMCCYDKAWINHYFYKSWEDWCYRMFVRGNMHNNFRTFDTWFDGNSEFKDKEVEMLNKVRYEHMRSTYIISNKHKLINGGNTKIVSKLCKQRKDGISN